MTTLFAILTNLFFIPGIICGAWAVILFTGTYSAEEAKRALVRGRVLLAISLVGWVGVAIFYPLAYL